MLLALLAFLARQPAAPTAPLPAANFERQVAIPADAAIDVTLPKERRGCGLKGDGVTDNTENMRWCLTQYGKLSFGEETGRSHPLFFPDAT